MGGELLWVGGITVRLIKSLKDGEDVILRVEPNVSDHTRAETITEVRVKEV